MKFWKRERRIRPAIAEICRQLREEDTWTGNMFFEMLSSGPIVIQHRPAFSEYHICVDRHVISSTDMTRQESEALHKSFYYRCEVLLDRKRQAAAKALDSAVLKNGRKP